MPYRDCRDALATSVRVCGRPSNADEYRRCMADRMGIEVSADGTCPPPKGSKKSTPCVLSSDGVTFCTDCTRASTTPQVVHAVAGMYGGPSKIVLTE